MASSNHTHWGSTAFVLLTDACPDRLDEPQALCQDLSETCAPILGFTPSITCASLPPAGQWTGGDLSEHLQACHRDGARAVFLLPLLLDFSIDQKTIFMETINQTRRDHPDMNIFYDDPDPCHPLLIQAFVDHICTRLHHTNTLPQNTALMLVASGHGDPAGRAKSYQLMRLLWEHLSLAQADVAFLRHEKIPLPEQLACAAQTPYRWILAPHLLFEDDHAEYTRIIYKDFCKKHPLADNWILCNSLGLTEHLSAWMQQRLTSLWNAHREKTAKRIPSPKHNKNAQPVSCIHGPDGTLPIRDLEGPVPHTHTYRDATIAEIHDTDALSRLFQSFGITSDPVFVKVTWHGYATGTYTDPIALDKLLSALPGRAVLLEGHTVGRNLGGISWDWRTESKAHRTWIHDQDQEYLKRTGLQDVIDHHDAHYLNVTEAYWDGQCANPSDIAGRLEEAGHKSSHPELCRFIPKLLLDHTSNDFISFARFKGHTRLSISNCFGLIPAPLRSAWHGPNITYFARVCCEMAKIYSTLFNPFGLVESLNVAIRWNRRGLYRSRWGHYDLIPNPGLITLSHGLPGADVLASRLQGQNVRKSAFFDVVERELGLPSVACEKEIDDALKWKFA